MGGVIGSTPEDMLLDSILRNKDGVANRILHSHPDIVNKKVDGARTTVLIRATYYNRRNIIFLLVKHGADVNMTC